TKAMSAASTFASNAQSILAAIKGGVDAFANLGSITAIAPTAIQVLGSGIRQAAATLIDISSNFDPKMVAAASDFSKQATSILGLIQSAAQTFQTIVGYASAPQQVIDILFQQIKYAAVGMSLAATLDGP